MVVRTFETDMSVLDAAKMRIRNIFASGQKIYLAFSSGKDSLCLSSLVYDLIMNGEINREQLTVFFIDEEGLYPSMVEAAERWRNNFIKLGVPFLWFCLPFKQVSVIDSLSATESWITWEPGKEDRWMRTPPPYAIMSSPYVHHAGEMNYQAFCKKAFADGIRLVGLRVAESYTRLKVIAARKTTEMLYPIYDWSNRDVWRYIRDRGLEFPEIYMRMYEAGTSVNNLRLCAFFGDGSTNGLIHLAETDPDLWSRILKREPNAYLALLYWDSEMFMKQTKRRKQLEENEEPKDYKAMVEDLLFVNTDKYRIGADTYQRLPYWRNLYMKTETYISQATCKKMYEGLIFGDPKKRLERTIAQAATYDRNKACGVVGVDSKGRAKNARPNSTTGNAKVGGKGKAQGE